MGIIHLKSFEFSNFQNFGRLLFQFSKNFEKPSSNFEFSKFECRESCFSIIFFRQKATLQFHSYLNEQALFTLQNRVTFVRQSSKHSMMYYLILLAWHTKYTIWIFAVTCCVALFTNEKERLQAWTEHEGNRILNSVRFLGLPDKIVFIGHTLISLRSSIN